MQRALALFQRAEGDTSGGAAVTPPPRPTAPAWVSPDQAVTVSDVYRGFQIISTAVGQLTMDQRRGGRPVPTPHALVRRPSLAMDPSLFYSETTLDLGLCGNAYWRKLRAPSVDGFGQVVDLRKLNPTEVHVQLDLDTDQLHYTWRGQPVRTDDLVHLRMFSRTGHPLGLGPIQAAQAELAGTIEARDYASSWLSTTDVPSGVLTTDQVVTPDQAKAARALWRGDGEPVALGHSVRVLGQGLKYQPLMLKPADVQFIESRLFNRTQLAMLLGLPSSLMLAPVPQGSSMTYTNVEQEWIGFNRFTLMAYLRPQEVGMTELLPHGSEARFNVDGLLRTDTLTRYQAHEVALRAGFLTVDEVRAIEGLAPLDRAALPTTTPELEATP